MPDWKCPKRNASMEVVDEYHNPDGHTIGYSMLCFECGFECLDTEYDGKPVSREVIYEDGKYNYQNPIEGNL